MRRLGPAPYIIAAGIWLTERLTAAALWLAARPTAFAAPTVAEDIVAAVFIAMHPPSIDTARPASATAANFVRIAGTCFPQSNHTMRPAFAEHFDTKAFLVETTSRVFK